MRQGIGRYSYVWIIPGWYADRWWEPGGDVVLDEYRCNSTELAMFLVHQRVIAISHHPSIPNMTLSEDGVCVSELISYEFCVLPCYNTLTWFPLTRFP